MTVMMSIKLDLSAWKFLGGLAFLFYRIRLYIRMNHQHQLMCCFAQMDSSSIGVSARVISCNRNRFGILGTEKCGIWLECLHSHKVQNTFYCFVYNRRQMSLHAMLHKDMQNEVPDSVLNHCSESDKVLVENLLRLPGTGRIVGVEPRKHNNSYRGQKNGSALCIDGPYS